MTTNAIDLFTMRELNLESCSFMKPEKFTGFHKSFISINGKKGFILQTPKLNLRNSNSSYIEFLVSRNKDRHREFYNIISHLEDLAILQISQNSLEWFGREIKREQVETMFRSCINRPLDINDSYVVRINKDSNTECEINYPIVCLIKIDGILFGRNSSTLDMKIVQVKVVKTEKIPSEEVYQENNQVPQEKPFYNDNASVIHDFNKPVDSQYVPNLDPIEEQMPNENELDKLEQTPEQSVQVPEQTVQVPEHDNCIEKCDEVNELKAEEKQLIEQSNKYEKTQECVQECVQPLPSLLSIDSIKCGIMKAMSDDNFDKVLELSILLQKHKVA